DLLADVRLVEVGDRAALNEAVWQVVGEVAHPRQAEAFEGLSQLRADAFEALGLGEQRIERLGAHAGSYAKRRDLLRAMRRNPPQICCLSGTRVRAALKIRRVNHGAARIYGRDRAAEGRSPRSRGSVQQIRERAWTGTQADDCRANLQRAQ